MGKPRKLSTPRECQATVYNQLCENWFIPTNSNQKFCPPCQIPMKRLYNRNHHEKRRRETGSPVIGTIRQCDCGQKFTIKSGNHRRCEDCKAAPDWQYYKARTSKYRRQMYANARPGPEKYPPHKCSRPSCNSLTTRRFLCDSCYLKHTSLGEIEKDGPGELVQLRLNAAALENELRDKLSGSVTIYSAEQYSQEELSALVAECR